MSVGEICTREVVVVSRDDTIRKVANLMRQYHVGDLVIVEENGQQRKPVGIITDRDIVIGLVAQGLDPEVLTAGDLFMKELVTAPESQGIFETIQQMRFKGIRRLPVVGSDGTLVGIVAIDDLIQLFAEEMGELAKAIAREQMIEVKTRK